MFCFGLITFQQINKHQLLWGSISACLNVCHCGKSELSWFPTLDGFQLPDSSQVRPSPNFYFLWYHLQTTLFAGTKSNVMEKCILCILWMLKGEVVFCSSCVSWRNWYVFHFSMDVYEAKFLKNHLTFSESVIDGKIHQQCSLYTMSLQRRCCSQQGCDHLLLLTWDIQTCSEL